MSDTFTEAEHWIKYWPGGEPVNDDNWMILLSWIRKNLAEARQWKDTPPTPERVREIEQQHARRFL